MPRITEATRPVVTIEGVQYVPVKLQTCGPCAGVRDMKLCEALITAAGCASSRGKPSVVWFKATPAEVEQHTIACTIHRLEN